MLKKNVGNLDRIIRVVAGAGLLIAFFMLPEASYRMWLLIGIVPLATGLMSRCPAYSIFGLRTCPLETAPDAE